MLLPASVIIVMSATDCVILDDDATFSTYTPCSFWSIPSINIKVNIQFWQNDNLNGVLTKVFHC